ncbi:MAG: aspartate kinase [Candidatus Aureabacteria bacterium]|nr:aspartate kinase [Candidatus Auribacterota bacterium]
MIVMKFGGTSVGNAAAIDRVTKIVTRRLRDDPVVVVSAVGGITTLLLEAAQGAKKRSRKGIQLFERFRGIHDGIMRELCLSERLVAEEYEKLREVLHGIYYLGELTPRTLDYVASFGERVSAKIVSAHFCAGGIPSRPYSGWEAGIVTNGEHCNASPLFRTYAIIHRKLAARKKLPVITGFIARSESGEITTLGRGGSDFTAAIIGRGMGAEEIQIWTDVTGIMTADPRVVPRARTIKKLSFAEAAELAYFGAKVLHPRTIEPAMEKNIPVRILNTFEPEAAGSLVVRNARPPGNSIRAIACKKNNILFNLRSTRMLDAHGYLARIFEVFRNHSIPVDLIATSEVSVSATVDGNCAHKLGEIISELGKICTARTVAERAIVCVVGGGIGSTPNIAGKVFRIVGRGGVNVEMISQASSGLNISFLVKNGDADRAVRLLHKEFLER